MSRAAIHGGAAANRLFAERFHRRFHQWAGRETGMVSPQNIWRKKRCAEDPEFLEKTRAECRAWWAANKDACNARRRAKRYKGYGISDEDYQALLARQGGACGICRKKKRPLCVDHCHVTGKVRGLLCHNCNLGLGHYNDDPVLTRAATAYLEASLRDPIATESSGVTDAGHQPAGAQLTLPFESGCSKPAPTRRSGRRRDRGRRERAGRGIAGRRNVASPPRGGSRRRESEVHPGSKKQARARRQARPTETGSRTKKGTRSE
jgi:Recombination endonuclease VII